MNASPMLLHFTLAGGRCLQHKVSHEMCQQKTQKQFYPHTFSKSKCSKSFIAIFNRAHRALVERIFTDD